MTVDDRTRALRTRALHALLRYREPGVTPYRYVTPEMSRDLLMWATTQSDGTLLRMRNLGQTTLHWIRANQPPPAVEAYPGHSIHPGFGAACRWVCISEGGWLHPVQCSNRHDEGGNCLDASGYIVGWREEIPGE